MKTIDELDKLYKDIEGFFNIKLNNPTRERLIVVCRYFFYVEGRKLGYTMQYIADKLGIHKTHCGIWRAEANHESSISVDKFYRDNYNSFINRNIVNKICDENKIITDNQLSLLDEIKKLSDSDILEFKETRLKPFLMMLETRKKAKQVQYVAGAMLNR
jgi:hypothetical protein